jgi:hypothetical protein
VRELRSARVLVVPRRLLGGRFAVRREYFRDYIPWRVYARGFLARERRCTRCGDDRVRPTHVPFGLLATLLGIVSMRCNGCTMKFAIRRSLAYVQGPELPEEALTPDPVVTPSPQVRPRGRRRRPKRRVES